MINRNLDAIIAKDIMRLEVVGWSTTFTYPEGPAINLGKNTLHTNKQDNEHQSPVYVEDCICDIAGEDWSEEERIHGHYFPCLGIVPRYQEDIAAAKTVLDKWRGSGEFCCIRLNSDYDFVWDVSWSRADDPKHRTFTTGVSYGTLEEAIVQGAIHAMVLKSSLPEIVQAPHGKERK